MADMSGDILARKSHGFAFLGFKHVLSALGLDATLQLFLALVWLGCIGIVLVSLTHRGAIVGLSHTGLLLTWRLWSAHARGSRPSAARGGLRDGRGHEECERHKD